MSNARKPGGKLQNNEKTEHDVRFFHAGAREKSLDNYIHERYYKRQTGHI